LLGLEDYNLHDLPGVKAGLGDLLVGGYNGGTEVRVVLCGEFERDEIVFAGVHREAGRPDLESLDGSNTPGYVR
jgi:hypothetical protein